MNRVALAIGFLVAAKSFAADADYCFAFMRNADVYISCDGREDRITQRANSYSFAISEEQTLLAVVKTFLFQEGYLVDPNSGPHGEFKVIPGSQSLSDHVATVNYKSGKTHPSWGSVRTLVSTCGGLFGVTDSGKQPLRRDLITGTDAAIDPYTWFRCSADGKVIAEIRESNRVLYAGTPPAAIAPSGSAAYYEFNMSPNGKYLAYASDRQPLCAWSAEVGSRCSKSADALDSTHDVVSVRNDGEVLVAMATVDKCVYKSAVAFAPAKPGNKKAENCIGIGHWRPGMSAPEVIEPVGRYPQWISPETAALLRQGVRKTYFGFM